jgi:hypothetical protein
MFRFITTLILTGVVLGTAAVTLAQDNADIPVLADGDTVEGTLTNAATAQLFAFNASEGDTVNVTLQPEATDEIAPCVLILGPAGQVVGADCDPDNTAATASGEVTFEGTHFILVSTVESLVDADATVNEDVSFTVGVAGNTTPPGVEDTLVYFRSDLPVGTSIEGYSSPTEPVFYFVFNGQSGQSVTIALTSPDIDALLMVFDETGQRIAVNDTAPGILSLASSTDAGVASITLPVSGLYFVFATDSNVAQVADDAEAFSGGNFVITLQ